MSKDKQRIIIAEACGWKIKYIHGNGMDCYATVDPTGLVQNEYPDYLNDLNAMHEAEEFLKQNDWSKFCEMNEILACKVLKPNEHIFHATAEQRAEAFIRTIEKREES